ncbi:hypothetical protein [Pseudomonas asplenii]|uniref:hypothetical protein n=1 Tax=Pseudomonas asplenii TaxID=53407 RepID=UPI00037DD66A|nr:hypothetical protein [Pseudomonas fuscovaginae]
MRVPIFSQDLLPQGAFRKLSKSIQNRWPGRSPIQLSFASEILSKALGYADYHALRNAPVKCSLDTVAPAEADVRAGIAAAISQALALANDSSVPSSMLERYVETLPLKALSAFKGVTSQCTQMSAPTHSTRDPDEGRTLRSRKKQVKRPFSPPTSQSQRQAFVAQLLSSTPRAELEMLIHQLGHHSLETTGDYVQLNAKRTETV